jgi:hypothetical protein
MNRNNNKVMTLDDARVELEKEGLSCDFVTDQRLVGVSSRCLWGTIAKVDFMIFVQKVSGVLTRQRYYADLKLLPSWVEQHNVRGNDCPPFGFAHGRLVMLVYYADAIEQNLEYEIKHVAGPREWCASTFVVAQNAEGQSFYLDESHRPYWGSAFYPLFRYRAQKLTGANEEHLQPPVFPFWIIAVNFLSICLIVFNCIVTPWMVPVLVAIIFLHFSVAVIVRWCRKRKPNNDASDYGLMGESDRDGIDGNNSNYLTV